MAITSIDSDARVLGFYLGLGDMNRSEPCMGYANACRCADCRERERITAEQASAESVPSQPWDVRRAA